MKALVNRQEIEIERKSGRLKDLGITHKCYIFLSGDDKNSTDAPNITAYGLQHATMITSDKIKPEYLRHKPTLIEDGEVLLIEGIEFKTKLIGDYSDCVHFEEVDYYKGKSAVTCEYN